MSIKNVLSYLVILLPLFASAQQRKTGPEQDCPGALPICDSIFTQTNSYSGWGQNHNELPSTTCLVNNENNSVWYIFNSNRAGYLEMILSPLGKNDDYDFALYDITGHTCADIATGAAPEVRCNYTLNDSLDGNGLSTGFGHGGFGTSSPPSGPSFNDTVFVDSNVHTFALLINNFQSGGAGYTLDFRGSSVNIADTVTPKITSISNNVIDSITKYIKITFSRPIQCDSIISDASQFTLTGPGNVKIAIDSAFDTACIKGEFTLEVIIRLKTPITTKGDYSLSIHESLFGLHLVDLCDHDLNDSTVIYTQLPVLKPNFSWPYISTCSFDTVFFKNNSSPDDSSYLWEFGDGTTSTDTSPYHVFPDTGSYQVTLITYSGPFSDSITQTVYLGYTGTTVDTFVCSNDSVGITIGNLPLPGVNYKWQQAQGISNLTQAQQTVQPTQPTWYYVALTDSGKQAACGSRTDSFYVDVKVCCDTSFYHQVSVSIDSTICYGNSLFEGFKVTAHTIPGLLIQWLANQGIDNVYDSVITITPSYSDYYYVTFTDTASQTPCAIITDSVFLPQQPCCDWYSQVSLGRDTFLCKTDTTAGISLMVSTTLTGLYVYWVSAPGITNNFAYSQSVNPDTSTLYYAYISDTAANGLCGQYGIYDSVFVEVKVCDTTGIENTTPNTQRLNIYPNPAQNIATIEWAPINEPLQFSVLDLLGREVKTVKTDGAAGKYEMDISELANGIYMVKLLLPGGDTVSGKLAVGR